MTNRENRIFVRASRHAEISQRQAQALQAQLLGNLVRRGITAISDAASRIKNWFRAIGTAETR